MCGGRIYNCVCEYDVYVVNPIVLHNIISFFILFETYTHVCIISVKCTHFSTFLLSFNFINTIIYIKHTPG